MKQSEFASGDSVARLKNRVGCEKRPRMRCQGAPLDEMMIHIFVDVRLAQQTVLPLADICTSQPSGMSICINAMMTQYPVQYREVLGGEYITIYTKAIHDVNTDKSRTDEVVRGNSQMTTTSSESTPR